MSNGRPVQIIESVGNHFELNEQDLIEILENDEIKDRFVVVVSVAGAFRKGKSFLLDFFIRYLNAVYMKKDATNWLGSRDQPLQGFSWSNGSERNTTGILMWSEVFLHEAKGEKIAIILLDTQGVFDTQTSSKNCALIFGLSTLLSSVQIYNLSGNVQENDLQQLQLFTEYGKMALKDTGTVPFQQLLFLIRDWNYLESFEYGPIGGNRMINQYLQITDGQSEELKSVRKHLKECFSSIECFLMPHPGMKILNNQYFDGKLEDLSEAFLKHIDVLVRMVLSPSRLIIKEVNGEKIRFKELAQYFKSYLDILANKGPDPKRILEANAEGNHLNILSDCEQLYIHEMSKLHSRHLDSEDFNRSEEEIKSRVIQQYDSRKKLGSAEITGNFRNQLTARVDGLRNMYIRNNRDSNELALVVRESNHLTITAEVKDFYNNEMENYLRVKNIAPKDELNGKHEAVKFKTLEMFKSKCEENDINYGEYLDQLASDLEGLFTVYKNRNEIDSRVVDDEAKSANLITLQSAIDSYYKKMRKLLEDKRLFINDTFEYSHLKTKSEITRELSMKIIGESNVKKYMEKLETHLDKMFQIFDKTFNDKYRQFLKENEARNLEKLNESRIKYITNIENVLAQNRNISLEQLHAEHTRIKQIAVGYFEESRIEGDQSFPRYLSSLNEGIDEFYPIFQNQYHNNDVKRRKNIQEILKMCLSFSEKILQLVLQFKLLRLR